MNLTADEARKLTKEANDAKSERSKVFLKTVLEKISVAASKGNESLTLEDADIEDSTRLLKLLKQLGYKITHSSQRNEGYTVISWESEPQVSPQQDIRSYGVPSE